MKMFWSFNGFFLGILVPLLFISASGSYLDLGRWRTPGTGPGALGGSDPIPLAVVGAAVAELGSFLSTRALNLNYQILQT